MKKEVYIEYVKRQQKGKKPPIACAVCGEDNRKVIEMHHVEGRNNSDWIKPLCKNCHSKITAEQNRLSPKARSGKTSLQNLKAFNIISIGALLREIGQHLINMGIGMAENV
ncbi:HNH endonuclease signature motif containing protein [uncultured Methanolobus sp.]|uniref:HNH endonuclease signature motif containing protein n=1 Tax=uncultured Methanolobus sp. TaxID=218300 RepID=UPI0029C6B544|nr:HNH endonuclease signature motif containing protein [uncultured Methanolobus sp.]